MRSLPHSVARLAWPLMALSLLLALNSVLSPGFFQVEFREGRLFGVPIDIVNHASKVMILAIGMTLVIATGGVDLSVGSVMAVSGAIAAMLATRTGWPLMPLIAVPLVAAGVIGAWNGVLVSRFRVQPIVATLVLMVAGRGVAQLITDGQIITFSHGGLSAIASTRVALLPLPAVLAAALAIATALAVRRTPAGLVIEAVGDSRRAARYAAVPVRATLIGVYGFCGCCAGVAGLIAASNIRAADSNNAGLFLELDAILAVVIGGTALTGGRFSLAGSVLGAVIIQTITTTMYVLNVPPEIVPIPKAIVVLVVCLLQSPRTRRGLSSIRPGAAAVSGARA